MALPTIEREVTRILAGAVERFLAGRDASSGAPVAAPRVKLEQPRNPDHGDWACNVAMQLARPLKTNPMAIAKAIVAELTENDAIEPPEIARPGFINLRLRPAFVSERVRRLIGDARLGVRPVGEGRRVVVDFSSPNIAKELHVGHLRSTIIGDSLARLFDFLGFDVLRRNHVGDWGTQFGMLIAHLFEVDPEAVAHADEVDLGDIVAFYKEAKRRFDEDEAFKTRSREQVVRLQSGDGEARRAWRILCDASRRQFDAIYRLLDVEIEEKGESFYNPMIPGMLDELERLGMLETSDGALCVFPEGFTNRDGNPLPLIVRKRDGGYNYDTTDMTTIRYRVREEKADAIFYVTDAGQAQHFQMVFAAARRAGWLDGVEAVHVPFGMVLGEDGAKLKTRSGETVRLRDLLDEAVRRARAIVDEKNPDLDAARRAEVAHTIGIGAVKYADLSQNRISDYTFSFDKMLALTGNTAPYLIYAYVRVRSILRKGGLAPDRPLDAEAFETLETPEELELGRALIGLPEAVEAAWRESMPNRVADYLFGLSQTFSRFYTNNRILGDPRQETRLALACLTADTLRRGLSLLGLGVIEEM